MSPDARVPFRAAARDGAPSAPKDGASRWLHVLTLAAALAAGTAHLAVMMREETPLAYGAAWLAMASVTLLVAWWWRRRFYRMEVAPAISPIVLMLFLLPFGVEAGLRIFGMPTHPLEVVLISGVTLVGLTLSAAGGCASFQPLGMTANLFATLFAASLSAGAATVVGAVGFALSGATWLAVRHWSGITRRAARRTSRRRSPLRAVLVGVAALLLPLAALGIAGKDRLWALGGFLPSSGGDGRYDPAARSGVGDGDALVAGQEDIQSFGPIEDAPFRESHDPSLYDLFNETYNEPVRSRKQDRAIPLPPEFKPVAERQMAKSQRAGQEFSTTRRSRGIRQGRTSDLKSTALFYVKGRVPLHLRHEVFDLFDGTTWYPAELPPESNLPVLSLVERGGRPWLAWSVSLNQLEYLAAEEKHAVKMVRINSNRFPTPSFLTGIHIDQLRDANFFQWEPGGLLRLDRDALPELTAFHYRSRAVDARRLADEKYWGSWSDLRCLALPEGDDIERIRALAAEWTTGLPRGWPQIRAVVERLRAEYIHDRQARPPEDVDSPLAHFLFESKRGPEYQFAGAAAVMLRTLGYSTRLVSGFHVSPERYDRRQRHTAVLADDTHFWAEVFQMDSVWVPIEPTPGFELLGPPPTWLDRVVQAAVGAARWVAAHWIASLAACIVLAMARWRRDDLKDAWTLLCWRLWPAAESRARVMQTLRVVDTRLKLARQGRPRGCPPVAWFRKIALPSELERRSLVALARLADWAAFAPGESTTSPGDFVEADSLCRAAVSAVRPKVLKSLSTGH